MREKKDRTLFGERLLKARTHAKLTQPQLAQAVGMAQSTLAGLESAGNGSSKTAQLAKACGVRVEWLSEGLGPMLYNDVPIPAEILSLAEAISKMPDHLQKDLLSGIRSMIHLATLAQREGLSERLIDDVNEEQTRVRGRRVG